ncbi:MAG TPA: hypothetical protein VFU63_07170 [Ktedonobacterales bacterium]|nr:hypothetical protein [Ktedonobacterales bacterium]
MATTIYADTSPLLEAIAASDTERMLQETIDLLRAQKVPAAKIAGRVGLAALWGSADPHALDVLATVGRVSQWMLTIPAGPEPGDDIRRKLGPTYPLVQAFHAVSDAVREGLGDDHPSLPDPILPGELKNGQTMYNAVREAFDRRDLNTVRALLMGFHATGADYRAFQTAIYGALVHRYPDGGHPLILALTGGHILDMAEWGDHAPPMVYWYPPLMLDTTPDASAAQAASDYAAQPEHDLAWLRTRLSIPKEAAAGVSFQQALLAGDGVAACDAVLGALRNGATPRGVASGMALVVAQQINAAPQGDTAQLVRIGPVFQYVHSVQLAMRPSQETVVFPMLYTAACAVNSLGAVGAPSVQGAGAAGSLVAGGLIPGVVLRSLEQQANTGEVAGAIATARRYIQMGHPPSGLAGILATVAAQRDITSDDAARHVLPLVTTACEAYLMLPGAIADKGQNALLTAAIRLASELRGASTLGEHIRSAIEAAM